MRPHAEDDPPRYPEWIRPVAADLERLGAPLNVAVWVLALLDATELELGPTPRTGLHVVRDGWVVELGWAAGDRVLRVKAVGPGAYLAIRETPDSRCTRAVERDHGATLRDLLGWLARGEEIPPRPDTQVRRKWWLP